MHLLNSESRNKKEWEVAGIELPKFDREAIKATIRECPQWVHFRVDSIFRASPAACQQKLLNDGVGETGTIVVEGHDYEITREACRPQDDLGLLVTLGANSIIKKAVVRSLARSLTADRHDEADWNRLKDILANEMLQVVSFTITEKGYSTTSADGPPRPDAKVDFGAGPEQVGNYIDKLTALCYWEYTHGTAPPALVNMGNCSHNSDELYAAVDACAKVWTENDKVDKGSLGYIENPAHVSLPWSVVGEITPCPDDSVKKVLEEADSTDTESIVINKNTYVAPFVNTEKAEYLVTEDVSPSGRPLPKKAGVMFTVRDTAEKVGRMKVCACLNPLYTILVVYGCLLGYTKISEEMEGADPVRLVEIIGYKEGLPAVTDPDILSPGKFIDRVLQVQIPNSLMLDTPQRIVYDTSQKPSVRSGETIREYIARPKLDMKSPRFISMAQAGWYRYLLGVDDEGNTLTVSPGSMHEGLAEEFKGVRIGKSYSVYEVFQSILSDAKIFGADLYEAGLGRYVKSIFAEMIAGGGVVRATLQKYLAEV